MHVDVLTLAVKDTAVMTATAEPRAISETVWKMLLILRPMSISAESSKESSTRCKEGESRYDYG
jgi:hypothetical protein